MINSLFCSQCGHKESVSAHGRPVTFSCSTCGWTTMAAPAISRELAPEVQSNVLHFPLVKAEDESGTAIDHVRSFLAGILKSMKEGHTEARQIELNLRNLEYQAGAVGEWLANEEKQKQMEESTRSIPDLQYRLFDRLQSLKPGTIDLVNCTPDEKDPLSHFVAGTFEAFGWTVNLIEQPLASHCGEEITFIVSTGAITYGAAAIHLALLGAGFRIYSQASAGQSSIVPRLHVHRLSSIPRLLPAIRSRNAQVRVEELRKSA